MGFLNNEIRIFNFWFVWIFFKNSFNYETGNFEIVSVNEACVDI